MDELIKLEAEMQLAEMKASADPENEKLKKEAAAAKKAFEAAANPKKEVKAADKKEVKAAEKKEPEAPEKEDTEKKSE